MVKKKYLIIIGGPTAVGKSKLAIDLALHYKCDVISADSRQFYSGMDIGTAKVLKHEMKGINHHFINHLEVDQDYSVGHFERDLINFLDGYFQHQDIAIICGGTGLYLKSVIHGLDNFPIVDPSIKQEIQDQFDKKGILYLQQQISKLDPEYASVVDMDNHQRLMRALSVINSSGKKFSSFLNQKKELRPFQSILINLSMDRDILYERINNRVLKMMNKGLLEEVQSLVAFRHTNALQTVGYKELFDYLDGYFDLKAAIQEIQKNTRRYAKRQMTWFRNQGNWKQFEHQEFESIINYIDSKMKEI